MNKTTENLIYEYEKKKAALRVLKKEENDLRYMIVNRILSEEEKCTKGTYNRKVNELMSCKIAIKENIKVDLDIYENLYDMMSGTEKECFKNKVSLVLSKYNKLDSTDIIDDCLIATPAMPSLSLINLEGENYEG